MSYVEPAPSRAVQLPDADLPAYQAPGLDLVGRQVHERTQLLGVGAAAGSLIGGVLAARGGASLLRSSLRALGGGMLGGVLGASLLATGGMAFDKLRPGARSAEGPGSTTATASTSVRADEDLRVMTFNVHGGTGGEKDMFTDEQKLDQLAEAIRRERPDVVLLQELDRFAIRSNHTDTLTELARRLDATGAVFTPRGTLITGRQEGTGVLTFNGVEVADARGVIHADPYGSGIVRRARTAVTGGIRAIRNEVLHHKVPNDGMPDYVPRVTSDAMLVTPAGNHVRVLSGHYNGPTATTEYQALQVQPIADLVDDWDGPTLVGADFNVRSRSSHGAREREMLGSAGLTDAFSAAGIKIGDTARASYGNVPTTADIDRIYASKHFTVHDARVADFPDGPPASDHHAVVADVRLRSAD